METTANRGINMKIMVLKGRIDANVAPDIEQQIMTQITHGCYRLVVDLQDVSFISSAGLRVLLTALKETRRKGGDLRLAGLQARVREVFDLTGFNTVFKTYPTVGDASRSFGAQL